MRYSIYFLQHVPRFRGVVEVAVDPSNFNWRRRGRGGREVLEVRYSIYYLQCLLCFGGVVEVEVQPSNFNWRRRGRGGAEVWLRSDIVYISCNIYYVFGVW